jgi:phage shock protein C
MNKRLQRSRTERMIGGVCGGLAEYFGVDPTLVRAVLAVVTVLGGAGVILYVVLWAVMPLEPPPPLAPGASRPGYQPWTGPPEGPPPGQGF